jgi:hypothetical protein
VLGTMKGNALGRICLVGQWNGASRRHDSRTALARVARAGLLGIGDDGLDRFARLETKDTLQLPRNVPACCLGSEGEACDDNGHRQKRREREHGVIGKRSGFDECHPVPGLPNLALLITSLIDSRQPIPADWIG